MARKKHPTYLPKTLNVRKKDYSVVPRSTSWLHKNQAFGMCNYDETKLEVAITKEKLENISTLAHEFAHAYIKEYRIKANKKWSEEVLVRFFERVFAAFYSQLNK